MLEFEVNGQRLRLKGNLYVVAESIDYLKARFSFSADWDGAAKTAIFKTADRKGVYNVILDENGICTVPSEVIHAPRFYVSVFGGSRITANEVEVQCNVSGYAEGSAPDTPTPEIYEQILAEINKKVSKVDGMGLSENSYTTEEKTKLSGIAKGAEVNVQSDWSQTNADADDYIKNKPTSLPASDVYDWAKQSEKPKYTAAEVDALPSNTVIPSYSVATQSKDGLMSSADKKKLDGLSEGGGGGIVEETDPTVPTWAKQPEKPTYTAAEVGADSTGSADSALTAAKKYTNEKVKTNVPENALFTDTVYDDTEIKTALGSEETARTKADTTLQNNINSEASARSSADTTLQNNITNEATARINADDTLQGNLDAHASDTGNPHSVTKSQVGLGNVPNVVTNEQTPTYTQASTLANLTSGEKLSVSLGKIMKAIADFISHKSNTDNPHSVTKSQVGLGNVDNTSDADKPISTAMQTALNGKLDKSGGTIESSTFGALSIKRTQAGYTSSIKYENGNGVLGYLGLASIDGDFKHAFGSDPSKIYTMLDSNNYKSIIGNSTSEKSGLMSPSDKSMLDNLTAILGYDDDDIVGLQVDYANCIFTRLAGAKNLTAGADFDKYTMFGGRRRCNVADDGTINAYYGDEGYTEDGSNGQVMVYQPVFYYKVVPLVYDKQETGIGYHLRKANYYVSDMPKPNFKRHPAFYDENGNEVDYILLSAYEGSIYDTSESVYLFHDEQVADFTNGTGDKLCSIAGVKPASGYTQNLTRANVEILSKNRGTGWHLENSKVVSMEQLLCMIEMGTMNFQTAIGQGVVNIPNNPSYNCSHCSSTGFTAVGFPDDGEDLNGL